MIEHFLSQVHSLLILSWPEDYRREWVILAQRGDQKDRCSHDSAMPQFEEMGDTADLGEAVSSEE